MLRVLFVDDDPLVLKALQHRARSSQGAQWEVHVAASGAQALDELKRQPIDAVISDMRMPGMDGAELLKQVRTHYPHAARLVLTGHSGDYSAMRLLPIAQQVLSKPCDFPVLVAAVQRSRALIRRLNDGPVREAIAAIRQLPVLPKLYWDLLGEMENLKADSGSIARIVEQDIAMTARVLQIANSAYFSPGRKLHHVREAITFLGLLPLRSMVLALHLFRVQPAGAVAGFSLERLQAHSLRTAQIASGLVAEPEERQTAFAAGVLHDIGKLAIAAGLPTRYTETMVRIAAYRESELAAEHAIFGCTHAEIGAQLLANWGLPSPLVEAVAFHHAPADLVPARFGAVGAVHVANALAHEEEAQSAAPAEAERAQWLDPSYLRSVGEADNTAAWREKLTALEG